MIVRRLLPLTAALLCLTACATSNRQMLVFGQTHTVGISIGATASEQGADFVLGYRDQNVAIVPVSLEVEPGKFAQIQSNSGDGFEDSLSVLGQFEVKSSTGSANVGLGKFFATGSAAKALADGFACKVANDTSCFAAGDADASADDQAGGATP